MTDDMTQIERARDARISRDARGRARYARADPVAILASLEEAAEGAARVAASRGIGAEERQIGGSRP